MLPVDDAIVEATRPHLPEVVADMVQLQRLTGMRPGELCALRPCDIDRTGEVWHYVPASHKTQHHGKRRTVFLGPQAQGILLKYLARDAAERCFRPCDSEAKRAAVRHAERSTPLKYGNRPGTNRVRRPRWQAGTAYTPNTYRQAVYRACDRAFPAPDELSVDEQRKWRDGHRWAPNRLRHSAATEIRKRFGLEAAQVVLGHAQASVTQVYALRDEAKGTAVAKAIG